MTNPQHESWILQALGGDHAAFGQLVREYFGVVLAHCRTHLHSQTDADDAVQETFIRAHQSLQLKTSLPEPSRFAGWLRGIARHVCLDMIRRNQRSEGGRSEGGRSEGGRSEGADERERPDPDPGPARSVEQKEEHAQLAATIDSLPETCREVLFLHYFNDMTYDQMAAWLGVARATVNERLCKARRLLRQRLRQLSQC